MTPARVLSPPPGEPGIRRILQTGRGLREKDNDRVLEQWVRETRGGTPADLYYALSKGRRCHLLLRQDGDLEPVPSGRDRTGLWDRQVRHLTGFSVLWDDAPLAPRLTKVVRGLGYVYRSFGSVERVDVAEDRKGGVALWFFSKDPGRVELRLHMGHDLMWPQEPAPREYRVRTLEDGYRVTSDLAATEVSTTGSGRVSARLEDGVLTLRADPVRRLRVYLSCDGQRWRAGDLERARAYHGRALEGPRLETPEFRLDKTFLWAKHDLLELFSETDVGSGFFAGMPCFSWFFGRDGEWMSLAAVRSGLADLAGAHLKTLWRHARGGRLPHELPLLPAEGGGEPGKPTLAVEVPSSYMSIDTNPLWVLASVERARWTRTPLDTAALTAAMDFTRSLAPPGDLLIENDFSRRLIGWTESWADRRDGKCIDANAWWVAAAEAYAEATGVDRYHSARIREQMEQTFYGGRGADPVPFDSVQGEVRRRTRTPAQLVPALYREGERYRLSVDALSGPDLVTPWGVRALSTGDPMFDGGYHTGVIWPLMTGWFVLAAFRQGLVERALEQLMTFPMLAFGAPDRGRLAETYHANYAEPTGQFFQGWSSSVFLEGVVEGLFGLRPDGRPGVKGLSAGLRPHLPSAWKEMSLRSLPYQGRCYDLTVRPGSVEVRAAGH